MFISFSDIPCSMSVGPGANKVQYRIVHLATCQVGERDVWLEWRNDRKTIPTSSLLSSYFGYGFTSLDKTIREKLSINPEPVPKKKKSNFSEYFSSKAKEHGSKYEVKAKQAFWNYVNTCEEEFILMEIDNGETSSHSIVTAYGISTEVVTTPDLIVEYEIKKTNTRGKMIVEFKCPYQCIVARGDKSVFEVARDFFRNNPKGKENSFIQAATYALVHGADIVRTVYYFTDTVDEEYIVVYTYYMRERVFEEIFDAIENTKKMLENMDRGETAKKLKIKRGVKMIMNLNMCCSNYEWPNFIYDVQNKTTLTYSQMNNPPTIANITGKEYQGNQVVIGADALEVKANSLATNLSPPLPDILA